MWEGLAGSSDYLTKGEARILLSLSRRFSRLDGKALRNESPDTGLSTFRDPEQALGLEPYILFPEKHALSTQAHFGEHKRGEISLGVPHYYGVTPL